MIEFPNRRNVYLDELHLCTYIHHNYAIHEDSLYDPMDDDNIEPLTKYKGQRYSMIAAIVNQVSNISYYHKENKTIHLIKGSIDIFVVETKDYHNMFNNK
ncbi:hypothetical protein A3Q56_06224 [Intoshia linei]|uniref:Uncharacterized protein n=1 Tax=Intoshia linei TaxID=1819745 RepID=A0A177AW40_9BILA|nr:hypothetical protein A3Q56_06224 [Intoshia linei]